MLANYFSSLANKNIQLPVPVASGMVSRVRGALIEARGFIAHIGSSVAIDTQEGSVSAEVIGFSGDTLTVMPLYPAGPIQSGAKVVLMDSDACLPAGEALLGRVLDGIGRPLDDMPLPLAVENLPLAKSTKNPLHRKPIQDPLDVGVKAINGGLTLGCGQRIGLFAGSGVGKSILLGMMTRYTEADIVIVALVGERGREVREFVENILEKNHRRNFIVVAATADTTPLMRSKAGLYASRLAEDFRDKGKKVLLLFDSLTRYAQAQRELALAVGEPPATRGYPASVFVQVPQLVERAGNGDENNGSVTAIYSVLTEGDDLNDPVAESARAILDGHIVLSRELAEEGVYPAIDLTASISRVMQQVSSPEHINAATKVKQLLARYESVKDMLRLGAYQKGQDTETDLAVAKYALIVDFIKQPLDKGFSFVDSVDQLASILNSYDSRTEKQIPQVSQNNNIGDLSKEGDVGSVRLAYDQGVTSHSSIVDQK